MARRASSGINTQTLLLGLILISVLLGSGYWLLTRKPKGFDAPVLEIAQALENSRSLSGNKYQVTGKLIDRRIEVASLVTLQVGEGSHPDFLSIKVPADFQGGNLNKHDHYTFLIEFNTDGLAVALDVKQL